MMRIIQNLRCRLNNRQSLKDYYENLNPSQLAEKKNDAWKMYLASVVAWIAAFLLIAYASDMSMPILILFSGSVLGTVISLYADYKNRRKLIEEALEKFNN